MKKIFYIFILLFCFQLFFSFEIKKHDCNLNQKQEYKITKFKSDLNYIQKGSNFEYQKEKNNTLIESAKCSKDIDVFWLSCAFNKKTFYFRDKRKNVFLCKEKHRPQSVVIYSDSDSRESNAIMVL